MHQETWPALPPALAKSVHAALEGLTARPGVHGVILVDSHGMCIAAHYPGLDDPGSLSALSATGMGAFRLGLSLLGMGREDLIRVEAGRRQLLLRPVGRDLMLVILLEPPTTSAEARAWLTEASEALETLVASPNHSTLSAW